MSFQIDKAVREFKRAKVKAWDENVGENDRAWTHDYVDIFVEWRRATPYSIGHLVAFTWPWRVFAYSIAAVQVWDWL